MFAVYILFKATLNFPEETDGVRSEEAEPTGNMSTIMLRMNQNIDDHKQRLKEAV